MTSNGRDAEARSDVLVVTATLGKRPEYLAESLASITGQPIPVSVVIVGPPDNSELAAAAREIDAQVLPDPGSLPAAINLGIRERGSGHDFVTWLNDDDLLEPGSLPAVRDALIANPGATVAYGSCRYVNEAGKELWVNKAGRLAPWILKWGPDLIPQPGSLIRRAAWHAVGGLDESYGLAFDLDLLLRLQKLGPLIDVGRVVSSFRWHSDSLTVDDRHRNIAESERAKRNALGPWGRRFAWTWEPPVKWATHLAAREVQRRARRLAGNTADR
jgi:GT2 family glycosyltransferase